MSRRIASSEDRVVLQAERDIRARLSDHELDFTAMSAVSNIYRTGSAVRNHMEREVLGHRSPLFGRRTGQILLEPRARGIGDAGVFVSFVLADSLLHVR